MLTDLLTQPLWPALSALLSVLLGSYVIIDIATFVSARYRDRYLEEAATELDDVLLQLPPGRVLDLSLALTAGSVLVLTAVWLMAARTVNYWQLGGSALVVGVLAFYLPRLALRFLKKRRLIKFDLQLEEALGTIGSALKAGFSINQALDEVAAENRHPIAVEFRLLTQEIRLGVTMEQALDNMNKRMSSEDFELVATAIITARQTGGELTSTLERLAALIRERMRINNKLRALTSMGRMQATMIGVMPLVLILGLNAIAPVMMGNFWASSVGYGCWLAGVVLDIVGFLIIRKICTIDV